MDEHNPYSAPEAPVEIELAPADLRLGSRWARLGAALVDWIIAIVVNFPVLYLVGYAHVEGYRVRWSPSSFGMSVAAFAIALAMFALVQGYPLAKSGQSWGKRLLGLRIVDLEGRQPGLAVLLFKRYAATRVVGLIPFVGPMYLVADELFIFSADKRCLHDLIADTRVVVAN